MKMIEKYLDAVSSGATLEHQLASWPMYISNSLQFDMTAQHHL